MNDLYNIKLRLNILSEKPLYWKKCFFEFLILYKNEDSFLSLFSNRYTLYKKSTYRRSVAIIQSLEITQTVIQYHNRRERYKAFTLNIFIYDIINNQFLDYASTSHIDNLYSIHCINQDLSITLYYRCEFCFRLFSSIEYWIDYQWKFYKLCESY